MKTTQVQTLFWSQLTDQDWNLYICATEKGLAYVGSPAWPFADLEAWAGRRFPGSPLVRDEGRMKPYAAELTEYFHGRRQHFTVPFDLQGTPFQLAVWEALCAIPFGQTRSYSDIAQQIRKPSAVRAVGAAIGANPLLVTVPCHRVLGKNGALTGYRGGLEMKTRLLALEKQTFYK
ncbi:MAG: methylated-DNA--[protein]-cysteine S-methyltransferase [Paenibacillus macerans]|uniref:methylated-DNA--[protein]-cysteine S-methyltransferase n=1 Tax=Paenibacillus macerans TaxID=44252 RepID=A0A090ZIA0_PAEMA|nr:methylated-DNA--[protein]-cysteine S-methyltransferase [Paenibacillus macerans]KFN09970.1 methylated-DNA--protein-cysteine methyltransferase, inducible [Paenibacillus macerans]MBS5912856.1 methylated-DNA--[protein]-cysteine S-methyltransferase [Paenibacillus macerans]MCY7560946.1 methylated-DNA--[protein]-cysteine S-methyltransferase [Paenibacillus macerans]MDU7473395.1 methylated-DNA--[protein]-cysteine S-methyltransferase [Paenibacillus macerans]MEC0138062.1 methylated-DNA--[protein]-cyst